MSAAAAPSKRLSSLDQFRGYTVAGMFLVNYLGGFVACPLILRHHNTFCSYADTIMPQFFFAVGFSLRLSFGRRVMQQGLPKAYWHMAKRLVGLALVAIFVSYQAHPSLPNGEPFSWETIKHLSMWELIGEPLKHTWFQTLMHIAATSLWILPVLRMKAIWRILYMIASALTHLAVSNAFNFDWVNGNPSGIDGGPFGFLTWTIPTMIGTLACDAALSTGSRAGIVTRIFGWGLVLMALGWIASCGTRLYDLTPAQVAHLKEEHVAQDGEKKKIGDETGALLKKIAAHREEVAKVKAQIAEAKRIHLKAKVDAMMPKSATGQFPSTAFIDEAERQLNSEKPAPDVQNLTSQLDALTAKDSEIDQMKSRVAELGQKLRGYRDVKLSATPVFPPKENWEGRSWKELLADPPFVPPPADDPRIDAAPLQLHRSWNYWMMSQRCGTISYLTFAAGLSLVVYAFFFVVSDMIGLTVGVFRTLGVNALVGYILHDFTGDAVEKFVPRDVPALVMWISFAVFFYITWLFLRALEKQKIYVKL
jgi:hypothetical protein